MAEVTPEILIDEIQHRFSLLTEQIEELRGELRSSEREADDLETRNETLRNLAEDCAEAFGEVRPAFPPTDTYEVDQRKIDGWIGEIKTVLRGS